MAAIEPEIRNVEHPQTKKKYSALLRTWHWINVPIIFGSLTTVLLNSTLFSAKTNSVFIQQKLQEKGVTINNDQSRSVAHELSDKIWQVHIYLGYTLIGLLLFRLVLEFFQVRDQKLIRKIKTAYEQYFVIKKNRKIAKHEFVVKLLYAAFYLMLITMAVTGLCLAFEDDYPLLKSIHAIREVHQFTMYLIIAFILVHLVGVWLAERKDSPGIVSEMINGGEENKEVPSEVL